MVLVEDSVAVEAVVGCSWLTLVYCHIVVPTNQSYFRKRGAFPGLRAEDVATRQLSRCVGARFLLELGDNTQRQAVGGHSQLSQSHERVPNF